MLPRRPDMQGGKEALTCILVLGDTMQHDPKGEGKQHPGHGRAGRRHLAWGVSRQQRRSKNQGPHPALQEAARTTTRQVATRRPQDFILISCCGASP